MTAFVEIYDRNHTMDGRDKLKNRHRLDYNLMVSGMINADRSCQFVSYIHGEHDKFIGCIEKFDSVAVRCNPGHIDIYGFTNGIVHFKVVETITTTGRREYMGLRSCQPFQESQSLK